MKFDWRGLIAAILAGGLVLTLLIGVTGAAWSGRPVGEKGGEVLVAICVAVVAALSTYFATARTNNKNGDKKE